MIGYKVVTVHEGKMRSHSAAWRRAYYQIGKTTSREQNNGALALFGTLEKAIDFLTNEYYGGDIKGSHKILLVEYTQSECREIYESDSSGWIRYCDWEPKNTIYAETITPLEVVCTYN